MGVFKESLVCMFYTAGRIFDESIVKCNYIRLQETRRNETKVMRTRLCALFLPNEEHILHMLQFSSQVP